MAATAITAFFLFGSRPAAVSTPAVAHKTVNEPPKVIAAREPAKLTLPNETPIDGPWETEPRPKQPKAVEPAPTKHAVVPAPRKVVAARKISSPRPEPLQKSEPMGSVQFDVDPDVSVFWNGRKIATDSPLEKQKVGKHILLIEKPGHAPIRSEVWVKEHEPTIIVAKKE